MVTRFMSENATRTAHICDLADAEHLSWKISFGLAVGDASDFDLWFSRFWRDGKLGQQFEQGELVSVVMRPDPQKQVVEWWTYGDWIIGSMRYLNCHYCVTSPELARMPVIVDLDHQSFFQAA